MFSTEKFGSGAAVVNAAMEEIDRVFGRGEAAKKTRGQSPLCCEIVRRLAQRFQQRMPSWIHAPHVAG